MEKYGYIALTEQQRSMAIAEQFKGEVIDEEVRFPKKLGTRHPFDFKKLEDWYNGHPFVKGAVDKHVDSIVADFIIDSADNKIKTFIQSFVNESNFLVFMRQWVLNALITGNGFAELDLKNNSIRVLDSKTMYVVRDRKGNVKGYNQYFGEFSGFMDGKRKNEPIPFTVNQIAHLKINCLADEAYGLGLIWPNRNALNFAAGTDINTHKLIERKGGSPYHVKIGVAGEAAQTEDIDDFNSKLQYLNTRTEWVTDANTEIKVVDFGPLGDSLFKLKDQDTQDLVFGFQVPATLMGVMNIPEGLAKVQLEAWQRRISSLQQIVEKVVEEKIFKQLLNSNGFNGVIEIIWELPGETETNERIMKLTALLGGTINISENMRRMIELELASVLNIKNAERYLNKPTADIKGLQDEKTKSELEGLEDQNMEDPERQEEENIKQPEVPGEKPAAEEKAQVEVHEDHVESSDELSVREWVDLKELHGFNYSDYLFNIIKRVEKDPFTDLKALSQEDLDLGLLDEKEVEKLRFIIKDGFKKSKTIKQIEADINRFINLKDRFILNENNEKQLKMSSNFRANAIARTETVRLANEGLLDTYQDNNIKEVRFLAALSERTCPECSALNGKLFKLQESYGLIPVHSSCRCTFVGVI